MESEADLLKALAEPTRLRLAVLLSQAGETCVCVLSRALDTPDYGISRHLSVLRAAGIVEARREGTWMYYRIAEPADRFRKSILNCLKTCFGDNERAAEDLERSKSARIELCGEEVSGACGPSPQANQNKRR